MKIDFKAGFFDRPAVINAVDKATRKALSKFGAFVRRAARSSLRRRKKSSAAGSPPSVHTSDKVATLKNIQFAYEPARQSVIVGAVKLATVMQAAAGSVGTIPALMEYGGEQGIREVYRKVRNVWVPSGSRRRRPWEQTRVRQAKYAPRPFMGPAFQKELSKAPDLWRNSVKP